MIIKIDTHGAFIHSRLADTMLRKISNGAKKAKRIKYIKYITVDVNNGILKKPTCYELLHRNKYTLNTK